MYYKKTHYAPPWRDSIDRSPGGSGHYRQQSSTNETRGIRPDNLKLNKNKNTFSLPSIGQAYNESPDIEKSSLFSQG